MIGIFRMIRRARLRHHQEKRFTYALLLATFDLNPPPADAPADQHAHWERAVHELEGKLEAHRKAEHRLQRRT